MSNTILVTGATGNVGREVVTYLLKNGFKVRAATRHPEKAKFPAGVEAVRMDYNDMASVESAVKDIYGAFLIALPMDPRSDEKLNPVIDLAKKAGVKHIVLNSVLGADKNEQVPVRKAEHHLMESGVKYTIIRPNFFMENFSSGYATQSIRDQHGIFLAAGDGKTSFISAKDIGEAVAVIFAEKHFGKEYAMTGAQPLDHAQVAEIISNATGEKITYHPLTEEQMLQGFRDAGVPEDAVQFAGMLYAIVRQGLASVVTPEIEQLIGHKPTTFEQFAKTHASAWKTTANSVK